MKLNYETVNKVMIKQKESIVINTSSTNITGCTSTLRHGQRAIIMIVLITTTILIRRAIPKDSKKKKK